MTVTITTRSGKGTPLSWAEEDKNFTDLANISNTNSSDLTSEVVNRINEDLLIRSDLADTSSAANGDALIGVKRTATGAIASTVHKFIEGQYFNVVADFGAIGNGVANDSTVIATAIAALPANGGTIIFPAGYTFLGHIVINRSHVRLSGYGATILSDGTDPCVDIHLAGSVIEDVVISGFKFNGNETSTVCIKSSRTTQVIIENNKITAFKNHGIYVTGDGVGGGTQNYLSGNRINASLSRVGTAAGIYIGDGGVTAAIRMTSNYVTNYQTSLMDHGVNTVATGNIYELGTNAVITDGGGAVYIGDWVESTTFTGKFYRIGDARTTIISPMNVNIADIDNYSAGQFPANKNKIMVQDKTLLGSVAVADGGIQWYSASVGGTLGSQTPKNMRGVIEVSGASSSAVFTFTNVEPDTAYYIVATPIYKAGSPAAGSNRVLQIVTSVSGFTLYVEAAPGAGTLVGFNWIMVR